MDYGIRYREIPLKNGKIDVGKVMDNISNDTKLLLIQRSTGYSDRKAITIDEMETAIKEIKREI